ncbi:MAG: DEAD/DEAH box helicase [Verrucomicrobiales bacterium]|nr:DEAD/DEAH box helicase [Verrucomicrobiales bacterium]
MDSSLANAFENAGSSPEPAGLQIHLAVPDLWQQDAIRALGERRDVIVDAPTGAGKTFIFESLIRAGKFLHGNEQAVYTVPTRALANDKWREWKNAGWKTGIATGDLAEDLDAPVLVATLETQRERLLRGDGPRLLVIDEYQMIGDARRGLNYELAVSLAPPDTQLLLLSGSVANPQKVGDWLERLGRDVSVIRTQERPVPQEDIPVQALPNRAPKKVKNFWQRVALGALLSNLGPVLVFAPQRRAAEKIARKIAEALPDDDPIAFSDSKLNQICGTGLKKLLRKRVAWHHSGLTFGERAAIVEPLAKAGQLRVIVATMGLAAGINFSVRSVFVTDTLYQDGPFQKDVSPDELLQMFGRAGRRGMDEVGYVIFGDNSPRLSDARALELHRSNEIDWPTLMRKMQFAGETDSPFEAAREVIGRLFSKQKIYLGLNPREMAEPEKEETLFGLVPTRKELRNSAGDWEPIEQTETEVPLREALVFEKNRSIPAESSSRFIGSRLPKSARLCRLDSGEDAQRRYGLEMAVATEIEKGGGVFRLTKQTRKLSDFHKTDGEFSREEIETLIPDAIAEKLSGAKVEGFVQRGPTLSVQGSFAEQTLLVRPDSLGVFLHEPEIRSVEVKTETHYTDESGREFSPVAGSPAQAWRKLGLIDESGRPTIRGVIFSFFQHGEGLAVAAALEDSTYPIDELIWHLANLRAGHRFEMDDLPDSGSSERLAAICRQTYGPVDFEGYLRLGLPVGYGEGAAEAVQAMMEGRAAAMFSKAKKFDFDFGPGDVERAGIEWLSFLRHVRGAPDLESNSRWMELKAAAAEEILKRDKSSPARDVPPIPASMLQRHPQHRLSYSQLGHIRD